MLREFDFKGAAEALRLQRRQKGGQIGIGRRQIFVNYLSPWKKHDFPLWAPLNHAGFRASPYSK